LIVKLHARTYVRTDANGNCKKVAKSDIILTKRYVGDKKFPAHMPKEFSLGVTTEPTSLAELYPLLLELETSPQTIIIRQPFKQGFPVGSAVRRLAENVVLDSTSNMVALDVDGVIRPTDIAPTDILAQAEHVISMLNNQSPEEFPLDIAFIAQASSSAGFSKDIKLHMWFYNTDAVMQSQMKSFMQRHAKGIADISLYDAVHPFYTATPIFSKGAKNPFEGKSRSVIREGVNLAISKNQTEYVRPVKVSDLELDNLLSGVTGSVIMDKRVASGVDRLASWNPANDGVRFKGVLPIYHNALQGQINIDMLDILVKKQLDYLRPGKAEEYIAQGKRAALANIKACSVRSIPPSYKNLDIVDIPTIDNGVFLKVDKSTFPSDGLVFLKASLGTGKTTFAKEYMKDRHSRFVGITDTVALVESLGKSFSAGDYRKRDDLNDFKAGRLDRVVGTLHSLQKLTDLDCEVDVVFIDEADSVMNTLLFASIIEESKKERIRYAFADLLRKARLVIVSDGDLSEETVSAYADLIDCSKPLYKIDHRKQRLAGVKAYKHLSESSALGALFTSVESLDEPLLLTTDGGPTDLNVLYNSLTKRFPDKVIEVIHAESTKDPIVRDIFARTIDALREHKIDVLLCSPSVTNGVDFNGYFKTTVVLTKTLNHTPNMRFQAMMRERSPEVIHYFFRDSRDFDTGYGRGKTLEDGWMSIHRKKFAMRREREYKTFIATFNYYLVQSGATVEVVDEAFEDPITSEDQEAYILERSLAILNATEWSCQPRHNDAYEIQKLIKFLYELEELDDLDLIRRFIVTKPDKKMEYLHKLVPDFWNILKLNNPRALHTCLVKDPTKFYLKTQQSLKSTNADRILVDCGIYEDCDMEEVVRLYTRWCAFMDVEVPSVIKQQEKIGDL